METLPSELLLQIISYLEPKELVTLQQVSRTFLAIARDNNVWKQLCFAHSIPEKRRRHQQLISGGQPQQQHQPLAEIVRAIDAIRGGPTPAEGTNTQNTIAPANDENEKEKRKAGLLASWDPTYPGERINFYHEYIQRHARHRIRWFEAAGHGRLDENLHHEATGVGILFNSSGTADKLIAPLEDGSISIWDTSSSTQKGRITARSTPGLLSNKGPELDRETRLRQSKTIMTETGAVECVSIDSRRNKGFFAVQNVLNEVDLQTLQVVSRTPYPFAITALSEAHHSTPLTVGTNWTLHLHDTRRPPTFPSPPTTNCELIAGNNPNTLQTGDFGGHVSLSQPGALSILHLPTTREYDGNGDIWVCGRFTSFLNYDRRFFPRLRGTMHSGARLSCLTAIPHPFIPFDLRITKPYPPPAQLRDAKSIPGHTLIAAGEYKGKGSLELYSLSSEAGKGILSSSPATRTNANAFYHNRQTASSSKLLSVAPHAGKLVFSDGNGNLTWVERDGFTPVRKVNINLLAQGEEDRAVPGVGDDIVQKILPTRTTSLMAPALDDGGGYVEDLVVWSGEGRVGVVGFGGEGVDDGKMEEVVEGEEGRREREYGRAMRRALERQALELRWLRGYGL